MFLFSVLCLLKIAGILGTTYDGCNQDLTTIPINIPSDTTVLKLCNNLLKIIPSNGFPSLPSLTELHLNENRISKLQVHALQGLGQLQVLKMSDNRITTIGPQMFQDVPNLISLDLSRSGLSTIENNTFQNLPDLLNLKLSDNRLSFIGSLMLQGLSGLTHLDLSWNKIVTIENSTFRALANLQTLDLVLNDISTINCEIFHGPQNLLHLDLSYNEISIFDSCLFDIHPYLKVLDLSNNQLSAFKGVLTATFVNLDLSKNKIVTIDGLVINGLPDLEKLDLGSNRITNLPLGIFSDIGSSQPLEINLRGNDLCTIPHGTFETSQNIEVDLSYNRLQCITICWLKQTNLSVRATCTDGIEWRTWNGLDSNGQCVIPPTPDCSLPSQLLALPQCCPSPYYTRCNEKLTSIPYNIPEFTTEINLCHNHLTYIPARAFSSFTDLWELFLDHNHISLLHKDAFQDTTLAVLDLSYNKIKVLQAGLFVNVGLDYLYYAGQSELNLSNNEICTIELGSFGGDWVDLEIDLHNNQIECLPPEVFSSTYLLSANLKNNKISTISPETLTMNGMWAVDTVTFSFNQITYVPAKILSKARGSLGDGISLFYLNDNHISAIHPEAFEDAGMSGVFLQNNFLTCLPEMNPTEFHIVDLSNNHLTSFPYLPGDWFSIRHLPLEGNPMQCSTICWIKQAPFTVSVNCAEGIDWDTWDGLDSNGQCEIPPVPTCPLPSPLPVAPTQCSSDCFGKYQKRNTHQKMLCFLLHTKIA